LRILHGEKSCADTARRPLLVISQFQRLYGGGPPRARRPTWQGGRARARSPRPLVDAFVAAPGGEAGAEVENRASFGADMQVQLVNDGPVGR